MGYIPAGRVGTWIPTKDKLPECGEQVLLWNGESHIGIRYGDGWFTPSGVESLCDITHWAEVEPPCDDD